MSFKEKVSMLFDEHARWYKKKFDKYKLLHLVFGVFWILLTALLNDKFGSDIALPICFSLFATYISYNVMMTRYDVKDVPEDEFNTDK